MKLKEIENIKEYKLCYVDDSFAYFTRLPLSKQWGDDWNDAPYEHNAGEPYNDDGADIIRLAYHGDLQTPCSGYSNSPYSVKDINLGAAAWLYDRYGKTGVVIHAGISVEGFINLVRKANGRVYSEVEDEI